MRKVEEDPNPLRDDEVVLELLPGGGHRLRRRGGSKKVDPLYQLFVPDNPEQTGKELTVVIFFFLVFVQPWSMSVIP